MQLKLKVPRIQKDLINLKKKVKGHKRQRCSLQWFDMRSHKWKVFKILTDM